MNKQVFTVEIDSSDYVEPVGSVLLNDILRMGFDEARMSNLSILSIEENNVEQTVERPLDQNKMVDLLVKACAVIDAYERDDKTDSLDNLSGEIQEFLDGKQ